MADPTGANAAPCERRGSGETLSVPGRTEVVVGPMICHGSKQFCFEMCLQIQATDGTSQKKMCKEGQACWSF